MADGLDLVLGDEPVRLLADRALYWPARRRLLLADLHLGKADVFRAAGIALPRGGTAHDLARLSRLVSATAARAVWILGDVLHGRADLGGWRSAWAGFRVQHPTLELAALAGNHDRALRDAGLDLELLGAEVSDGPFLLRHDPANATHAHVLCGHLHPVLKLPGQARIPAFWLQPGCTVLPAFSAFTGGHPIRLRAGDAAVACNGDAVVEIRPSRLARP